MNQTCEMLYLWKLFSILNLTFLKPQLVELHIRLIANNDAYLSYTKFHVP